MTQVRKKLISILAVAVALVGVVYGAAETAHAAEIDANFKKSKAWTDNVNNGKDFKNCMNGDSANLEANKKGTCKGYKNACKALYNTNTSQAATWYGQYCTTYRTWKFGDAGGDPTQVSGGAAGGSSSSSGSGGSSSTSGSSEAATLESTFGNGGEDYKDCGEGTARTSLIGGGNGECIDIGNEGEGIFMILNIALSVMTYGVGILATLGLVISGYVYLTAKDDASKIQKSKDRILQIVIGLVLYATFWTVCQFILPGGLFGGRG